MIKACGKAKQNRNNKWWSKNSETVENNLTSLVQRDHHKASQQGHVEVNLYILTKSKPVNDMMGQVAKQVDSAQVERVVEDHLMQAEGEQKKKARLEQEANDNCWQ